MDTDAFTYTINRAVRSKLDSLQPLVPYEFYRRQAEEDQVGSEEIIELTKENGTCVSLLSRNSRSYFRKLTEIRRTHEVDEYNYTNDNIFCYISGIADRREMFFFEIAYYVTKDSISSYVSYGLFLPRDYSKNITSFGFIKSPYQMMSCLEPNKKREKLERLLNLSWSGDTIQRGISVHDFSVISILKLYHGAIRSHNISPCFVEIKRGDETKRGDATHIITNFLIKNLLIVCHGLCISRDSKKQTIMYDKERPIKSEFHSKKLVDDLDYGSFYKGNYTTDDDIGLIIWHGEGQIFRKTETSEYSEITGVWKQGTLALKTCKLIDSQNRYYPLMYLWDGKKLLHTNKEDSESVAIWGPIYLENEDLSVIINDKVKLLYLDCYFLNMERLVLGLFNQAIVESLEEIIIGNFCLPKIKYFGIFDLPNLQRLTLGYQSLFNCLQFILFGSCFFFLLYRINQITELDSRKGGTNQLPGCRDLL